MPERDTHFGGSAQSVLTDMLDVEHVDIHTVNSEWREKQSLIIARYAYDLAIHVVSETIGGRGAIIERFVNGIPDLIEVKK